MRKALPTLGVLVIPILLALPPRLWPGVALGLALGIVLANSRLRDSLLLFAGFPGLYLFLVVLGEPGMLLAAFADWALLGATLLLLGTAGSSLAAGKSYAPLLLLPLLLVEPSGPVLAGIVLAQLVWTFSRQRGALTEGERRGLLVAGLVALPLLLGIAALSPVQRTDGRSAPGAQVEPLASEAPPDVDTQEQVPILLEQVPSAPAPTDVEPGLHDRLLTYAINASMVIALVFLVTLVIVLFLLLRIYRGADSGPKDAKALLPLAAVSLTVTLLLVWNLLSLSTEPGGGALAPILGAPAAFGGTPAAGEAAEAAPEPDRGGGFWLLLAFLVIGLLGGLLMHVALLLMVWKRYRELEPGFRVKAPAELGAEPGGGAAVDSRIRRAYAGFLAFMRREGLGRRRWESPRGYAERLAADHSPSAGELDELTRLYEAVRYGEDALEPQAARAEALADSLTSYFRGQAAPEAGS